MRTNRGHAGVVESVSDAYSESFTHSFDDLGASQPRDAGGFAGLVRNPRSDATAEDQRDDALRQILVYAAECDGLDIEASLLEHLAAQAVDRAFVEFEYAARRFPMAVVPTLNRQDRAVVGYDCRCNTDGGLLQVRLAPGKW